MRHRTLHALLVALTALASLAMLMRIRVRRVPLAATLHRERGVERARRNGGCGPEARNFRWTASPCGVSIAGTAGKAVRLPCAGCR
jgi:hypothetical protein